LCGLARAKIFGGRHCDNSGYAWCPVGSIVKSEERTRAFPETSKIGKFEQKKKIQ
jgi:hypothetical protein